MTLKAIDTLYDGHLYRSRLEARWAVFFNGAGIEFEYEKEGYDLDGVYYLPDFYIPHLKAWIEIKAGEPSIEESDKAGKLAAASGRPVYIFFGQIVIPNVSYCKGNKAYYYEGVHGVDMFYEWCECPDCGLLGIQFDGRSDRLPCKECYMCAAQARGWKTTCSYHDTPPKGCPRHSGNLDKGYTPDAPRLVRAYRAAMTARFEHAARK